MAAGEVVERPYSVVKELVENSLDAGAKNVKVEILNWWKQLIKVSDDGIWISKEDLPLTIEEFATSKISKVEDLYQLGSFWFRGEALSTISEVSKFKIITKKAEEWLGWQLEKIWNDVKIQPVSVNFQHWTEVYVQDLFYNLPVRKKFLKSEQTEFKYIHELMQNYSILNYDKWFELFHNKKQIFSYSPKQDLIWRLQDIFPKSWAENYLNFEFVSDKVKLYGVMGKSILKFNSSMIKIFVNNRPVKDKIIQKAIMQAYSRWIEPGMYPFVILFLELDAALVDVNVHPRKEEVKFLDPGTIYNLVFNTIKENLEQDKGIDQKANYVQINWLKSNLITDNSSFESEKWKVESNALQVNSEKWMVNSKSHAKLVSVSDAKGDNNLWLSNGNTSIKQSPKSPENLQISLDFHNNVFTPSQINNSYVGDIQIIWQIFDSYILFTKGTDFYIMDQHAVAERIIFEKMRKEYNPEDITLLSVPLTFQVNLVDWEILKKLQKMWFDISEFWQNKVILYAVPKILEKYKIDISALINSLLHSKLEDLWVEKMLEQVLATKSCKAAIKANHKLSFEEMKQLIIDWQKYIDGFFVCQHWRPSVVKLHKDDIDKLFDRK